MNLLTPGYQRGATTKDTLIALTSIVFLVLAFRYRLNALTIDPWKEQIFRVVMLVYFNYMLYLIVPALAKWLNQQNFMIQENKTSNNSIWVERSFMGLSVFLILTMVEAQVTGIIAEVRRYGSGPDFHALHQPAQFWSSVLAGYFITLFSSTLYWQMRLIRLGR